MAGQESNFQLRPQDYLDWFSLDYTEKNKIMLAPSMTGGTGLEAEGEKEKKTENKIPLYKRYDLGTSYAKEHVDEYLLSSQEASFNSSAPVTSNTKKVNFDTVSSVARSRLDDYDERQENRKTDVYYHYDFDHYNAEAIQLPVNNYKGDILDKIEKYSVVVIEGKTGSGKSTQVPQFILDDAVSKHAHVNIVVTQPRKIAAISLANRICEERNWQLGSLVGYQVGLNKQVDEDTRLAFVTTEVLVQKLVHRKNLDAYTHIILDEVHERDQHTDFALLLVKKLLASVSNDTKIVLMSATIDCEKFSRYFASPVRGYLIPAPVISISESSVHPVKTYYLDALRGHIHNRERLECDGDPRVTEEMFRFGVNVIQKFDDMETFGNRGAVLVFLPGIHEIERFIECLKLAENLSKWEYYPLHSSLTYEEQSLAFKRAKIGYRKIIVSTNIAESSITVPDIKFVVDFCLTKTLSCDPLTNYTYLKLDWASKASLNQRAGRAGRVAEGTICRLINENFFENLDEYTTPEMCRSPLTSVVLKVKLLDMGGPQALLGLALDPPNLADIHRTILVLKQIGAMSVKKNGVISSLDGDLTFLGEASAHLPIDPHLSKLIIMGFLFGCLHETTVMAAALSLKAFHSRPFQDELNAYLSKISWSYGSFSDCLALLNTYKLWRNHVERGAFEPRSSNKEKIWAKQSYVQLLALKEVHRLVEELEGRLENIKITERVHHNKSDDDQAIVLKMCIAAAFYPNYFKRHLSTNYEREICRELNNNDPFSTVVIANLPQDSNILYDQQLKIIFKGCSIDPIISYEGQRAYIRFIKRKTNRDNKREGDHFHDIPGEAPTALYLALKMRQIPRMRNTLRLNLLSTMESERRMNEIATKNKDFETKSIRRTVSTTRDNLSLPPLPHPQKSSINVQVVHVEDAGRFWAITKDQDSSRAMYYISHTIQMTVDSLEKLPNRDVVTDAYCLAPFRENEVSQPFYYRAKIEEVTPYKNSTRVLVWFVDYGNTSYVLSSELKPMPPSLYANHEMAYECRLSEVKPASRSNVEASWTPEANAFAIQELLHRQFEAEIYSVVHNVLKVRLVLDEVGSHHKYFNDKMVAKGFASSAEEFISSKRNHELRNIYTSDMVAESVRSERATSCYSLVDTPPQQGDWSREGQVQHLRGPNSPLEMNFVALSRMGLSKKVRIDGSSVNSATIDMEPQNPHDRMMVSSFVSLNAQNDTVTLRDSTLMPCLPGVLSICLMLFAPVVELRVNDECTKFTGALIGLGYDQQQRRSVYPDDDIETSFDFPFQTTDLAMLNSARYLMSSALEEGRDITDKTLMKISRELREIIKDLLNDKRPYCEPEEFSSAYRWNCIPADKLMLPKTRTKLDQSESISFQLINGVDLREEEGEVLKTLLQQLHLREKKLRSEKQQPGHIIGVICPGCGVYMKTAKDLQDHITEEEHNIVRSKVGL